MRFINRTPLSRRTVLRNAGVCLSLPMLEAMMPTNASAMDMPKRFFALFYPNGTSPKDWEPSGTTLSSNNVSPCLQDLVGFGAEGIWPACSSLYNDITVVNRLNHEKYGAGIHSPYLCLQAHKKDANSKVTAPSLDQKILERPEHRGTYPSLTMSSSRDTSEQQGTISWKAAKTATQIDRNNPDMLFQRLFGAENGSNAQERIIAEKTSLLDFLRDDVSRLKKKLGQADQLRVDEFENSLRELEQQLAATAPDQTSTQPLCPADGIERLVAPKPNRAEHHHAKYFIDIAILAMSCDMTRVASLLYSNSWGVNYEDYVLGNGQPDAAGTVGVGAHSDHFISHKLGDRDRAKDLDGLPSDVARRIADERVILTSRFKVRRFSYIVDQMRKATTPTGNLLDESLVLYCSEIGNGDSHNKKNMPTLLAGRAGGFQPGRIVDANGANTAALHGAILNRFGFNLSRYGNPAESPLSGI